MKLTESRIRQIIREEARRVLREVDEVDEGDGGLVIHGYDFEVEYNDPETSSQQALITFNYSYGPMKGMKSGGRIYSFGRLYDPYDFFLGRPTTIDIVFDINNALEDHGIEHRVTPEEVWPKLEPFAQQISDELEREQEEYLNYR